MKKIYIVGNTFGAGKAAELVRQQDQESDVILLSTDGNYPYNADRLADFVSGQITQKELLIQPKDFYEKNRISVILDKSISKINLKRSRIFTEQKDQWEYDVLMIADLPGKKFPDIKGSNKEGIYNFRSLPQVEIIIKKLPLLETVAIQADSFEGLEFACSLKKKGKEVFLFVSENSFFVKKLLPENQKCMIEYLNNKGLSIMADSSIAEILGDSDVKAVRLKSGKVLAAQMIVFENMREDWKIFSENELQVTDRFEVDDAFETSIKNVYAFEPISKLKNSDGKFTNVVSSHQQWKQIQSASAKILGKEIIFDNVDPVKTLIFDEIIMDSTGMFKGGPVQQLIPG